ncbi:MAG: PAS domain S-box protein [Candidatus Bathyarchaeia archaeon]|jgi:two-component system CheB/CheR fusion protein
MLNADQIHRLKLEIENLQARVQELEETMASVCGGTADSIIVSTIDGDKIFTLKTEEQTYRLFIENMLQGAVLLSDDDTILYCNKAFAEMINDKAETIVGKKIQTHINPNSLDDLNMLMEKSRQDNLAQQHKLVLDAKDGSNVKVQLFVSQIHQGNINLVCMVFIQLPLNP